MPLVLQAVMGSNWHPESRPLAQFFLNFDVTQPEFLNKKALRNRSQAPGAI